jgi:hypothetical protein
MSRWLAGTSSRMASHSMAAILGERPGQQTVDELAVA